MPKYEYKVGVDATGAIKGLSDIKRAAKDSLKAVTDEFDESKSAAKAFADGMRAVAGQVETELKGTAVAADALGAALGPELAGRLGQNGLDQMVADLRKGGLTFDDIKADADELADAIKRLDTAASGAGAKVKTEFDQASTSSERLRGETDKTASVMANTMGNSAQGLADSLGIAGIAGGSLGVTIGQLAEYSAEGGVSLGQLAKQAGPMIAVTAAVALVGTAISRHKEEQKEVREAIEKTTKALTELGNIKPGDLFQIQAFQALIDPTKAANAELKEFAEQADDLTNMSMPGLSRAVAGGADSLRDYLQRLAAAAGVGDEFAAAVKRGSLGSADYMMKNKGLRDTLQQLFQVWEQGDDVAKVNEAALKANADAVRGLLTDAQALDTFLRQAASNSPLKDMLPADVIAAFNAELAAGGSGAETFIANAELINKLLGSQGAEVLPKLIEELGAASTETEKMGEAHNAAGKFIDRAGKAIDAARTAAERLESAYAHLTDKVDAELTWINLQQKFRDVEAAGVEAWNAAVAGSEDAAEKAEAYRVGLLELQKDTRDYGAEVLKLPPEKLTKILAELDEGMRLEVRRQLDALTETRDAVIRVRVTGAGPPIGRGDDTENRATGGPTVAGGFYQVAESGSELLREGGNTYLMAGRDGTVVPLPDNWNGGTDASNGLPWLFNNGAPVPQGGGSAWDLAHDKAANLKANEAQEAARRTSARSSSSDTAAGIDRLIQVLTSFVETVRSDLAAPRVTINIAGSVLTENQLIDVVHRGLLRLQARNGTLGIRAA